MFMCITLKKKKEKIGYANGYFNGNARYMQSRLIYSFKHHK